MNTSNNTDMSAIYIRFLELREQAEKAIVPSEKSDALHESTLLATQMIERLALLGAALNANFRAVENKLNALGTKNPELLKQIDNEIGSLIGLRTAFLGFYGDEAQFCDRFEHMVRDRMLQEAGVDPNDQEAAMAYLLKAGNAMVPAPEKN